ncbi:ABC transporter ATP-binding protein [Flavobacterium sinopsychrotolerans]|uniref:Lipopolysaccharide transport system ATP-binding protein n=1 Tax=Flavobacterium sinopsychrotolerans TaxID=604089 RepID=A0A1H8RKL6_9FLAO|nr:ABC transporter ATP-binding protein [Flavobacterium sinopsychrotolerans]SEO67011.1 lipopolysaccharide transport system ATP-binding protein [Flavobacterium sinopsychrotolerans]
MGKDIILKAENISKQYRLGQVGTGTISHDLNRWWHKLRGKEDPYLKIGDTNDRSTKGDSDYVWALQDINFEVERGEVIGIIGKNGAGKSTLLKILSKVAAPTTGSIKSRGRIASLLEVGTGFHPELTGRENIFLNGAILGMTKKEIAAKLDEIIDFSGCERYIDTPVKRYSSGMTVRLAFAVAAFLEPEILIIDEVLAVGDAEFQKKALGKMQDISRQGGRTVLFVSHNMAAVKSLCTRGIVLEHGKVVFEGGIDEAVSEYLKVYNIYNKATFLNAPILEVNVEQENEHLIIKAKYNSNEKIDIPNFGFIIYNEFGNPILGGNPVIHNLEIDIEKNFKIGEIEAKIINPRLVDGAYTMSIWFGDSKENHFEALECVMFEIKSMVDIKYVNTSYIGSVTPNLEWKFNIN